MPLVSVFVLGEQLEAYLDSGSPDTFFGQSIIELLSKLNISPTPANKTFGTANGKLAITSMVTLDLELNSESISISGYLAANIPTNLILGRNFLRKADISVMPERGIWTHKDQIFHFCSNPITVPEVLTCFCLVDVQEMIDAATPDFPVKEKLSKLLLEFEDVFSKKPGLAKSCFHKIDTGNAKPTKTRVRAANAMKKKIIDELFDELLTNEWIEPSKGEWSSGIVLAPKKTGGYRLCVDYRQVNAVTVSDVYPLPLISEILRFIESAKVFSIFDATKGFYHVEVQPEDRPKTAFITHRGLWQFKRMPFGLKNAPASFQRLMDIVLGDMNWKCSMVYIDDIILFSDTVEQHFIHLEQLFLRLRDKGITLNPDKSYTFKKSIGVLGHIIDQDGIKPNPELVRAILDFPTPGDAIKLQSFIGSANFFRDFVEGIAAMLRPLYHLTKKGVPFIWDSVADQHFVKVKKALCNVVLARPNLSKEFVIHTDASFAGIGAALMQMDEEVGALRPIAFISRSLKDVETRYPVTDLECLAVVYAIKKFAPYIEYTHFTLATDHQALKWLMTLETPKGRLAHWAMLLQGLDFTIIHRPGSKNWVADALSRNPVTSHPSDDDEFDIQGIICSLDLAVLAVIESSEQGFSLLEVVTAQKADKTLQFVAQLLETDQMPLAVPVSERAKVTFLAANTLINNEGLMVKYCPPVDWEDDMLLREANKIVTPDSMINKVLELCHDNKLAGHKGVKCTLTNARRHFIWYSMTESIKKYVKTCLLCQKYRYENQPKKGLMSPRQSQGYPWQKVSVDFVGPLPRTARGFTRLMVFTDIFSGYPEAYPIKSEQVPAKDCVNKAMDVFCRWGFPHTILSDNGPEFASQIWYHTLRSCGIKVSFITPYHAQANPTERVIREVTLFLAKYCEKHKDWDLQIPAMLFSLRSSVMESTGHTPAKLVMFRDLFSPFASPLFGNIEEVPHKFPHKDFIAAASVQLQEAVEFANAQREVATIKQKCQFDKHRIPKEFYIGQKVFLQTHPISKALLGVKGKFCPKREGPFEITAKSSPISYVIGHPVTKEPVRPVHVVELTPAFLRDEDKDAVPPNFAPPEVNQKKTSTKRIGNGRKRGRPNKSLTSNSPPIILEVPEGVRRSPRLTKEVIQLHS